LFTNVSREESTSVGVLSYYEHKDKISVCDELLMYNSRLIILQCS